MDCHNTFHFPGLLPGKLVFDSLELHLSAQNCYLNKLYFIESVSLYCKVVEKVFQCDKTVFFMLFEKFQCFLQALFSLAC